MRLVPSSDASLLVEFADRITPEANSSVIALFRALRRANPKWLRNLHPAYTSLLIDFDLARADHATVEALVRDLPLDEEATGASRRIEVPVQYGGENGPDLEEVAVLHSLTPAQVIELHASTIFRVAFLGFVPGFAYLMGLPEALHTPRLSSPRTRVPAGSVAIAAAQAAIYPAETPGGWRLIGRTRMPLPPDWAAPGDEVVFRPEPAS